MNFLEKRQNLIYSILSGILLALSFPPLPFPFLAFAGFVPLLFILSKESEIKFKYLFIYLTFFIYHTGSNWWISSWSERTDPFLLFAGLGLDLFHPLFFLFPFWLFFIVKKNLGANLALISFPFLFIFFEWAHSIGEMAFPWLTLGNTQITNLYWIQFIDITGIWGASFIILIVNILILKLVKEFLFTNEKSFLSFILKNKKANQYSIYILLLLFLPYFYSFTVLQKYDYTNNLKNSKNVTIGIVQPNIDPWLKWEGDATGQIIFHQKLSDSLLSKQGNIDLFLWSETAVPFVNLEVNSLRDVSLLSNWVDKNQVNLLTGFSEFKFLKYGENPPRWSKQMLFDTSIHYLTFNSSVLFEPNKNYSEANIPQSYHKSKLTPFGELFPYKDLFPYLAEKLLWDVGISNWNVGEGAGILKFNLNKNQVKVGNIICIESIHPDFVRRYVQRGANIFTVITNDGWYDHTTGPRQHYLLSCIRAIENRRYIARVGNTGISGFISPFGTSMEEIPPYTQSAKAMTLPLIEDKTIYSQWGNWFAWIASAFAMLFIILSFIRKFQKK